MSISDEKLKALDTLRGTIDKEVGKGTLFFGDDAPLNDIEVWPLSSPKLTYVIGRGWPKGRIAEVYGPESSGKTSLCTLIAADIQKAGGVVAFVDSENAFDRSYAKKLGLDTNTHSFLFSQPDSGENALEVVEHIVSSGAVDLIIVDSVAALTPQAEIDGDFGDSHMGLQARLMSQAMRKLTSVTNKNKCSVVFINQIRLKIGTMFGNPETTTGGKALPFYASIRLEVRKVENINKGTEQEPNVIGQNIRIKAVKNKVATPFRKIETDLYFGRGFDLYREYLDFGITYGIISKSGSWYSIGNNQIGQGKDNSSDYLRNNPTEFNLVREQVDIILSKAQSIDDEGIGKEVVKEVPKRRKSKKDEEVKEDIEVPSEA